MKKIYFAIALLLPLLSFAQRQSVANLTVFSEDGYKFYLVLNGERQNDIPQSNIRIEELPQPYYSARVIFADSTIAPVSKNSLMLTDADGTMMDVTYRIKVDKNKKAKLNAYSAIPVQQDFIAPSGTYVRHYGRNDGGIMQDGVITRTTTTSNTIGASVNVPGMNVNISISDPDDAFSTTTTTTTTTSSSSSSHSSHSTTNPGQPSGSNCNGWPMKAGDFSAAKQTILESAFDDTRLSTAKSIASSNCLSTDQVVEICKIFSFEDSKLAFAKYAYKYTTDPKNYFKVNNVFAFSSSKDELNALIGGGE